MMTASEMIYIGRILVLFFMLGLYVYTDGGMNRGQRMEYLTFRGTLSMGHSNMPFIKIAELVFLLVSVLVVCFCEGQVVQYYQQSILPLFFEMVSNELDVGLSASCYKAFQLCKLQGRPQMENYFHCSIILLPFYLYCDVNIVNIVCKIKAEIYIYIACIVVLLVLPTFSYITVHVVLQLLYASFTVFIVISALSKLTFHNLFVIINRSCTCTVAATALSLCAPIFNGYSTTAISR